MDITIKGQEYSVKASPNKGEKHVWDLVVKNIKTKQTQRFYNVFWYTEGWSQGTGRSQLGYYLNIKGFGSMGNGSGRSSKTSPYFCSYVTEHLTECLSGEHFSAEKNEQFKLTI